MKKFFFYTICITSAAASNFLLPATAVAADAPFYTLIPNGNIELVKESDNTTEVAMYIRRLVKTSQMAPGFPVIMPKVLPLLQELRGLQDSDPLEERSLPIITTGNVSTILFLAHMLRKEQSYLGLQVSTENQVRLVAFYTSEELHSSSLHGALPKGMGNIKEYLHNIVFPQAQGDRDKIMERMKDARKKLFATRRDLLIGTAGSKIHLPKDLMGERDTLDVPQ